LKVPSEDQKKKAEQRERLLKRSIAASVLLHGALAGGLALYQFIDFGDDPEPEELVWIEDTEDKQRVVFDDSAEETDEAEDDAFFSRDNRKTDEQTVAKETNTTSTSNGQQAQPKEETAKAPDQQAKPLGKLAKFGLKLPQKMQHPKQAKVGQTLDQPRRSDYADVFGKRYEEYVEGMKEGQTTVLNTKEFVFFTYYERIRRQLEQAWPKLLQQKMRRLWRMGGRFPASEKQHKTQTILVLDQAGEVIKVSVVLPSGTQELDDAAVEAFNEAGPFPNPPEAIVDDNGLITINWTFVLTT
jgi:TonB family protein